MNVYDFHRCMSRCFDDIQLIWGVPTEIHNVTPSNSNGNILQSTLNPLVSRFSIWLNTGVESMIIKNVPLRSKDRSIKIAISAMKLKHKQRPHQLGMQISTFMCSALMCFQWTGLIRISQWYFGALAPSLPFESGKI